MSQPEPIRLPLQYTTWNKEHFESEEGIHFFNQSQQQIINTINYLMGHSGPVGFPTGIDMAGANIKGLSAPAGPTDAVSAGHADQNYGAASIGPQLDIGGKNASKGLTNLYLKFGALASKQPGNYAGGGYLNLFGLILQFGDIANMDTAVFPMNFPTPFLNSCQSIVASTTGPADRITYVTSFSATQFSLANNGTGAGATWIAVGY